MKRPICYLNFHCITSVFIFLCLPNCFQQENGKTCPPMHYPSFVMIQSYDNSARDYVNLCGGHLYNMYIVLTPAHCFNNQDIKYGRFIVKTAIESKHPEFESNNDVPVKEIKLHPDYKPKGDPIYDLCILKLQRPLRIIHTSSGQNSSSESLKLHEEWKLNFHKIKRNDKDNDTSNAYDVDSCTLVCYGLNNTDSLACFTIFVISAADCLIQFQVDTLGMALCGLTYDKANSFCTNERGCCVYREEEMVKHLFYFYNKTFVIILIISCRLEH